MAELVQLHIESTIPELEQMERIGLFARNEIKKIIQRRRTFEYALRRRKKSKEDILKYIQYEVNLLSLIGKRRMKLRCDFKKREIDHTIATRINKLFKTVTLRFQDDVKLWISQIEFCKRMNWYHSISGLFIRMLQVHSSDPTLWVMAAKFEMEENNAPENARQLLQRALRHHEKSTHLWLEYFRMELMYSDMVRKRREILGIQEVKTADKEITNDAILNGTVASVVYKSAMMKIEDVEFALSFLPICQQFSFTQKHIEDIFNDIQTKFPNAEETLDAVARYRLLNVDEEIKQGKEKGLKKKVVIANIEESISALYEEAVTKVPTSKMWQYYIQYSLSRVQAAKKIKNRNKIQLETLQLFKRAFDEDCLDSNQCMEWVRLLRCCGNNEASLEVTLHCVRKWPKKASLWHTCLSLHIADKATFREIASLFDESLASVKERDSFSIWQLGLQYLSLMSPSKMVDYFEAGIQRNLKHGFKAVSDVISPLKVMYLEVIALQQGIQAARDLYTKLNQSLPVPVELYKKMISIESAQLKPCVERLRKCYEDALRNFGSTNVDLWLAYMKMEIDYGNSGINDILHWRAMKALDTKHIDEFVSKMALFAAGHELKPITSDFL